jgi:hypothetical protein
MKQTPEALRHAAKAEKGEEDYDYHDIVAVLRERIKGLFRHLDDPDGDRPSPGAATKALPDGGDDEGARDESHAGEFDD